VKYINCLDSERANGARRTSEIKFRIAMAKEALKRKTLLQQIGLILMEETSKVLHLRHIYFGAATWTFWEVDQK
jgi:hypothetical protein